MKIANRIKTWYENSLRSDYEKFEQEVEDVSVKKIEDFTVTEYRQFLKTHMVKAKKKYYRECVVQVFLVIALMALGGFLGLIAKFELQDLGVDDILALQAVRYNHYDQVELEESMESVIKSQGGEYTGTKKDFGTYLMALVTRELNDGEYSKYSGYSKVVDMATVDIMRIMSSDIENDSIFFIEDGTAYLKFDQFIKDETRAYFESRADEIMSSDKLIIDLSDNGGGHLDSLVEVLELFVPKDEILFSKVKYIGENETDVEEMLAEEANIFDDLDIVLITGPGTASCSELFTMKLKNSENHKVLIAGEPTYAKTLVYKHLLMGNGGYGRVVIADGMVDGRSATANPIFPDKYKEFPYFPEKNDRDFDLRSTIHITSVIDYVKEQL